MDSFDNDREPLDALATEFVKQCREGQRPSIEEFARRCPELAADIRDLFPTLLAVEGVKGAPVGSTGSPDRNACEFEQIGDFRIIRELGRGGMGIVYEDRQLSLDRAVAIKILPPAFANDSHRKERFDREARTAARLHHTNIVPIFGVGEVRGSPYFVMQYIWGVGLDVVFQSLSHRRKDNGSIPSSSFVGDESLVGCAQRILGEPSNPNAAAHQETKFQPIQKARVPGTYWRSLAVLLAQAADAFHFAHTQGVLHRDIKPSNLLIDAEGTLWVTDFGLAKVIGHEDLTEAGDVIGTIRYLAPEQFSGQSNAQSDLYSLGITAYEMATLTPAFAGSSRSSTMRAILDGSLPRPRTRCAAIPLDLETIILKATARSPADRYPSAAAFRDDLRRFVEDLPISVRRVPAWERARRWSRRNPALALVTGCAFVLLLAIAAVSTGAFFHVQSANDRVHEALLGETRQREKAEAITELAINALDTVFDNFAPDEMNASGSLFVDGTNDSAMPIAVPHMVTAEEANLLSHLLDFYGQLADRDEESDWLRLKTASANRRAGEIYELLGRYAESDSAYRAAIQTYQNLESSGGDSSAILFLLAQTRNELGELLATQDRMFDAQREYRAASDLLEPMVARPEAPDDAKFELARTYYLSARRNTVRLLPDPSRPRPDRENRFPPPEFELQQPRPPRPGPPPPDGRRRMDRPPPPGGEPGMPPPPIRDQQVNLDRAIDILGELRSRESAGPKVQNLLALCLREREIFRGPQFRPSNVEEAVKLLEELVDRFPSTERYRFDLAETLAMQDRGAGANGKLQRALSILQSLVDERPAVPNYRFALGHMHLRRSHAFEVSGASEDALKEARIALEILTRLADDFPETTAFNVTAALAESVVAKLLEEAGQLEPAKALLVSATDRLMKIGVVHDPRHHMRAFATRCFDQLSRVYFALNDDENARNMLEIARSLGPGPLQGP